jgi:hypothetical protein
MAVSLSALRASRAVLPRYIFSVSDTHFSSRLSKPQGLVRLERLSKLKKKKQWLTGIRTRDRPSRASTKCTTACPELQGTNGNRSIWKPAIYLACIIQVVGLANFLALSSLKDNMWFSFLLLPKPGVQCCDGLVRSGVLWEYSSCGVSTNFSFEHSFDPAFV